jgi:hypothetical protein
LEHGIQPNGQIPSDKIFVVEGDEFNIFLSEPGEVNMLTEQFVLILSLWLLKKFQHEYMDNYFIPHN